MSLTFALIATIGAVAAYDDPAPQPNIDIMQTNYQDVQIPKSGSYELLIDSIAFSIVAVPKNDTDVWDWYKGSDIAKKYYQLDGYVCLGCMTFKDGGFDSTKTGFMLGNILPSEDQGMLAVYDSRMDFENTIAFTQNQLPKTDGLQSDAPAFIGADGGSMKILEPAHGNWEGLSGGLDW